MSVPSNIRNLIFDFGGVIINIDFRLCIQAFVKLGAPDFGDNFGKYGQNQLFDDLDTGTVSEEQFIGELKKLLPPATNPDQIIGAWNSILMDIPEHRIRLLEKLKQKYRLFLLSNTNSIHYRVYSAEMRKLYGYNGIEALFEKGYFSFKLGLRKPDPEIFRLILNENHLDPAETAFIDDSEQNLPPAGELGIEAIHIADGMDMTDLFS